VALMSQRRLYARGAREPSNGFVNRESVALSAKGPGSAESTPRCFTVKKGR
jgi:hypothetical protein